jgi:predicted aminopeptidase
MPREGWPLSSDTATTRQVQFEAVARVLTEKLALAPAVFASGHDFKRDEVAAKRRRFKVLRENYRSVSGHDFSRAEKA